MTVTDIPITATVTREGKRFTIVFDADLLGDLNLESGATLKMTRQGKQLVFEEAPATPPVAPGVDRAAQIKAAAELSHARYAEAYRKLAE